MSTVIINFGFHQLYSRNINSFETFNGSSATTTAAAPIIFICIFSQYQG
jgi:hypothetical protein